MDCRDFQNLIPVFLDNKLNNRQAKVFFEHFNSCEECKEELRIQYLVQEGTQRLEEGKSFDLNKELDLKIFDTQKSLKKKMLSNFALYVCEAITLVAVLFILILVFFTR